MRTALILFLICLALTVFVAWDSSRPGQWTPRARDHVELQCYLRTWLSGAVDEKAVCGCAIDQLEAKYGPRELNGRVTTAELKPLMEGCLEKLAPVRIAPAPGSRWTPLEKLAFVNGFVHETTSPALRTCVASELELKVAFAELAGVPRAELARVVGRCQSRAVDMAGAIGDHDPGRPSSGGTAAETANRPGAP